MHEGHRKRMIDKAGENAASLADHELLEIFLYHCIPRVNTNPVAHELIAAFGSLKGVFSASYRQLLSVRGVGEATAAYLRCAAELAGRIAEEGERVDIGNLYEFRQVLQKRLAGVKHEIVELYCMDAHGRLLFRKEYTSERGDKVDVQASELNRVLADHRPRGVIVAHNHPFGPASPSEKDDKFTGQVQLLCSMNGAYFYDHVIVGKNGYYSYFEEGRMEEIRKTYRVDSVIGGSDD